MPDSQDAKSTGRRTVPLKKNMKQMQTPKTKQKPLDKSIQEIDLFKKANKSNINKTSTLNVRESNSDLTIVMTPDIEEQKTAFVKESVVIRRKTTLKASSPPKKQVQVAECDCKKIEPVVKNDVAVMTGLELEVMYAADVLLKELKAPQSWRESLMMRMIEDANLVGDMNKNDATKFVKDLIKKVEQVKQRAAGGVFIAAAESKALHDLFASPAKKDSRMSWHFMSGNEKKRSRTRQNSMLDDTKSTSNKVPKSPAGVLRKKTMINSPATKSPITPVKAKNWGPSRRAQSDVVRKMHDLQFKGLTQLEEIPDTDSQEVLVDSEDDIQ